MDNMLNVEIDHESFIEFAQSAAEILNFYEFCGSNSKVRFAIDYAEIHSYLMPEADFFSPRATPLTLPKYIRQWYVARCLIDNPLPGQPTLLLPPYLLEFRHHLRSIQDFLDNAFEKQECDNIIKTLRESEEFSNSVRQYKNDPQIINLYRVIDVADKVTNYPFVLLIEIISDSLRRNIADLNQALEKKTIIDASTIYEVDQGKLVEESWDLTEEIKRYYQEKVRSTDSYSAFIDALAIWYVSSANKGTLINNKPFIILVSRSSLLPQIDSVSEKMEHTFPSIIEGGKQRFPTINVLWKPETYLLYRMMEDIYEGTDDKIYELRRFNSIIGVIETKTSHKADVERILANSDGKMGELINNFFFVNTLIEKSKEKDIIKNKYKTNQLLRPFTSGIDLLISMIENKKTITEGWKASSDELWAQIQYTNERISALEGLEGTENEIPEIRIAKIGNNAYCDFKINTLSFNIKLGDAEATWIALLENALREERKDRGYLKTMVDFVTDAPKYSPNFNILVAALNICGKRLGVAKQVLKEIDEKSDGDLFKEIQLLVGAIAYLDETASESDILACVKNLKQLLSPNKLTTSTTITREGRRIKIQKKRSLRIFKMVGLLYYKLHLISKDKYLDEMIEFFDDALARTKELINEKRIDNSSGQMFLINSLNNVLWAYADLYEAEKGKDVSVLSQIVNWLKELKEQREIIPKEKLAHYKEMVNTIERCERIVAQADRP